MRESGLSSFLLLPLVRKVPGGYGYSEEKEENP